MKRFKEFSKDEDIKDFEEDVIMRKPNTTDAMKRYVIQETTYCQVSFKRIINT